MGANYGWSLVEQERKREIIAAIASGIAGASASGASAGGDAPAGPTHAEIDLTDRCNVACYFCNQQDVRTTQQLPLDKVFSLLDELVAGGLRSVRLSGGGDPLAHREVGKVLARLTALGVNVDNVNTNGALLTAELGRLLIENRCRELIVSLNAVDAADYHRMMQVKPATFDQVLANVRRLVGQRGELPLPVVTVQFLIDRENFRRIPEMYALGRSLGAGRITISPVQDIPLQRIDHDILLAPADGELVMPYFAAALAADRDAGLLSLFGPFPAWNQAIEEIRSRAPQPQPQPAAAGVPPAPTAPAASPPLDAFRHARVGIVVTEHKPPTSCVASDTVMCIDSIPGDQRFKATVTFHTTQAGGAAGNGNEIPLAPLGLDQGGMFWFFNPDNPEMLVKVIDGCAVNGHFWVFISAGTNVGYSITVTDTAFGATRTYTNNDLTPAVPVQDTSALTGCT